MALTKQAKLLTESQLVQALNHVQTHSRYPNRDALMLLLSCKAGMRAKEITSLTWEMVLDSAGNLSDEIRLPNSASKGKGSGRCIPTHPSILRGLAGLWSDVNFEPSQTIITSERGDRMTSQACVRWFGKLYRKLGFIGCSSHSGRRTFITKAARLAQETGCSIRDLMTLSGHKDTASFLLYVDGNEAGRKALVDRL